MKNKASILSKAGVTLLFLLLTTACAIVNDKPADDSNPSSTLEDIEETEDKEKEEDPSKNDRKITEKMNAYVGCINDVSNEVYESRDRYFERVDPEAGPVGEKAFIWIQNLIFADAEECYAGVTAANAINVEPQLNPLADAYVQSLKKLDPILNEGNKFYAQDDYRDDPDGSKGQDLHNRFMEALNEFKANDDALRDEMDKVQAKIDARLLEELKNEGDQFGYLNKKLMLDAQILLDLGNVENFTAIDLDQFNGALETYKATLDELVAYGEANPGEAEANPSYKSFIEHSAESFYGEAKNLMRDKRDGTASTERDQIYSINQLINAYNNLIEASNRLSGFYY